MSIRAIAEIFGVGVSVPSFRGLSEEYVFTAIRKEAEAAMLHEGSPLEHPLDDRIGRVVARYIWLSENNPARLASMPPIETVLCREVES